MSNQSGSIFTVARTVVLNLAGMLPFFPCGVGLGDTSVSAQEKAFVMRL
jgi:hypothetical protein